MNSNPFFTGKTKTQNQLLPKHMLPYSEPIEVSHFSKTKSGETFFDSRNLKRTRDPQLPFDLNERCEFRDRDRLDKYPAPLLPLFESLERSGKASLLLDVDVLSWRGNMSKLLCAPWESREGFRLECELVRRKFDHPDEDDAEKPGGSDEDEWRRGRGQRRRHRRKRTNKKLKRTSSTNTNNSTNDATTNSSGGGGGSPGDTVLKERRRRRRRRHPEEAIRNISNNSNAKSKRPATLVLNVLEAEHKLEEAREMLKNNKRPRRKTNQKRERLSLARADTSYWGLPRSSRTPEKPHANAVNCLESFCTVTKSKLGENTKLLLGGEVDCWNGKIEGLSGYVELKDVSRKIDS